MKKSNVRKIIALVMALCILCGMLPTTGAAAAETRSTAVSSEAELRTAVENNGEITLSTETISISEPIRIKKDKTITIVGSAVGRTTINASDDWKGEYDGLFIIEDNATVVFKNLVLDGKNTTRCVNVQGPTGTVTLDYVMVQNGNAGGGGGGGVYVAGGGSGTLTITNGCVFQYNQTEVAIPTGGGAIYVGSHWTAHISPGEGFDWINFTGNKSHSGACIYSYQSYVLAEKCRFGTSSVPKAQNQAGQRGGAVHCHGTVVLKDCEVRHNTSDQYGGGIYVSADGKARGVVLLDNTKVEGNDADNNGGGVFVASMGSLYLKNGSSITGNSLVTSSDESLKPDWSNQNNLYYSNALGRIVLCDDSVGPIGISTANPYNRKLALFSIGESGLKEILEEALQGFPDSFGYHMDEGTYMMENGTYSDRITSDSHVWLMRDLGSDPEAADYDADVYTKGRMWLNIDPSYGVTGNQPSVIFDYNLPGVGAAIYPSASTIPEIKAGDKITTPTQVIREDYGHTFKLLGWSTQPTGGTSITPGSTVTVKDGIQVYYAQWDITPPEHFEPVPIPGSGLFTVYFDYNYPGGGVTSTLVGTIDLTFNLEVSVSASGGGEGGARASSTGTASQTKKVNLTFKAPKPYRWGYTFKGWSTYAQATSGSMSPTPPTSSTTYYAIWQANSYTLKWDANGGTGGGNTTQRHDETVKPPTTPPTRTGYTFTGWYLDKNCTIPLTSGTLVTGAATFYAGWTPLEYTITWDANYTGGTVTAITQYHDEKLNILPKPVREGYDFGGWYTKPGGAGTRAESYGKVREDVTFYAKWTNETLDYTVRLEWDDRSNNDNVRPERIVVSLMANDIPTGLSYTLDASDADASGNLWSYTFEGLDVTDAVSNPITYSVAITSTVSDQYSYGIENKSATLGYILMTHSLITRDVDAYVVWDDNSNQDGIRPATATLQLYFNGVAMTDSECRVALSGSGNTWFYRFHDVQKYYTDAAGNKGQEVKYTIRASATNPGELSGYTDDYHDYTAILSHVPATVSRTVHVEWQDSNDQDGKRPVSMAVQLYADNVPLEGKVVLLSSANNWTYTWDDLDKYADGGREVVYSARVSSTLVDYTAKSTGMTIEMTYVPSSTSISAFVTWTDEHNADGLRPDYITAQLVADGKPTGDSQVLSATSGWTVTWTGYPIYKNGDRIEYTFQVDVPDGYEATYHGVYDTSGLSAVLRHERLKQSLKGNIVWEDRDNQSGGRMGRVAVVLYADGSVIDEDDKVWISAEDGWEHTFSNLPIYRDHGQEIKYTMVLVSDPGKYIATTSKMTVTMRLEPEYVDVPFQVVWDDNNDSDGARPSYVPVALLADGHPSGKTQSATAQSDWAVTFTHLDYSGPNGVYRYRAELAEVPDGYTVKYPSEGMAVLKRTAETKDVTASVTWYDNNDQYRERPQQVTLTLYADRLDGNGPQNTGRIAKCKGADGWTYTFEDVPAYYGGKNILYSVVASGNLPNYTISYDGMEVFMRHTSYQPQVTVDYTAKVVWHDGHNTKNSRPYNILVTLYANGDAYTTQTLTEAHLDDTGYTWSYTFTGLPTKADGKEVAYTIGVTEPAHYTAQTQGNTVTLTHVMDMPILVRWHDQRDNDGVRPDSLTLELYADSVKTDTAIALTGLHDAETWRNSFLRVPVWSDAQMDREIVYTWAFAGNGLADKGYTVNYNGFATATVGNEDLYPIDISRPGELTDVSVSLKWDDYNDRDGLRLKGDGVMVTLYTDSGATDKTLKLTGSNEAKSWTGTFENLPVWKNGQRIQYSIQPANKEGYSANPVKDDPLSVTMKHKPDEAPIEATVVWDTSVQTKFDIAAELLVDGVGTNSIGVLEAANGYTESWGTKFVYRDHGTPIVYSVRVAEPTKIPEWHVAEVEGLTITVKRVKFQLTGCVYNMDGHAVPTALVTLIDIPADKILGQIITDNEGRYAFTVPSSSYLVQANVSGSPGGAASAIIKDLDFDTTQDLTLSGRVTLCNCTIKVIDNNGNPIPGAEVDLGRINQGLLTVLTMDENGTCQQVLPASSYNFQASYTYQGHRYRSDLVNQDLWGSTETITITVPIESADTKAISGTVVDVNGKPVPEILVQCYRRGEGGFLGVETKTDVNGHFTLGGLSDGTYELILKDQKGQTIVLPSTIVFDIPKDADTSLSIVLPGSGNQDPTPSGYGTLSGVVLDKNGQPVSEAQVVVTDTATGGPVDILITAPDGTFETRLPVGAYTVEIRYLYNNDTDHPIRVDDDSASSEDGPVTADSFTISGEVLDEDGQPVEGVTVYLYGEDGEAVALSAISEPVDESGMDAVLTGVKAGMETALLDQVEELLEGVLPVEPEETDATQPTDASEQDNAADLLNEDGFIRMDEMETAADGKYIFSGLPAGRYIIKIASGIGGNGGSTDIPVTVQPLPEIPDDASLTVTTDSYTVSGVVADQDANPVNGAEVKLLDTKGNEVSSLTTGEDGAYAFENLPKGDYTVNISYPDSELLASGDVTITDGGFTAFPGQLVSGTVKDNKGNVLPNVTATLRGENSKTYTATTDKNGSYHVVVPDGKYTVEININGKTASKTITVNGKAVTADLTITLSSGTTTTPGGDNPGGNGGGGNGGGGGGGFIPAPGPDENDPTEEKTFVLSGTVTDKDGKPIEGANVTATDTKTGKTYTDTTGADGKYAMAVPKGSYTITISYGSTTSNPKKVNVSKDAKLDAISMDSLGTLVYAYVNGYPDGTFGGEKHISRSEVAALISRVSKDFDKDKSYGVDFKDVPDGAWYANNLGYCVEAGLMEGRGNGHFDPTANITRAEFAAVVARFLDLKNELTGESRYTDTDGNWAEGYIAQLTAKGIVEGKGDGKFDPNAVITRYEAVTMLNRALARTPDKAALDALAANRTIRPFPDLHPTHWAYHQVLEAAFDHYHK